MSSAAPGPSVSACRSRYTLAELWDDGRGILVNTFSGAVDQVSDEAVAFVRDHARACLDPADPLHRALLERGYYVPSSEAEDAVARSIATRARSRADAGGVTKYMFGLTLRCNLACSYCWQVLEHAAARQASAVMSDALVDAAFAWIDRDLAEHPGRRAWVSLFGGEPLCDQPELRHLVHAIGERAVARGLHLHFTTNGRDLAAYRDEVRRFRPSIQVTVDGARSEPGGMVLLRDRQPIADLYPTLAAIARAGEAELSLRFLADETSAAEFAALADHIYADADFSANFTLAVAPLQNKTGLLDPRIPPKLRVLAALLEALRGRPYTARIAFVDWRSLQLFAHLRAGQDLLPAPVFFHCEANVDLTCFGEDGRLYACYEALGNPELAVGRYHPEPIIDQAQLDAYRRRSAFAMPACTECALSPFCGGGCAVRSRKAHGRYGHPFCDGLHAETRTVLRRWQEISALLGGVGHAA